MNPPSNAEHNNSINGSEAVKVMQMLRNHSSLSKGDLERLLCYQLEVPQSLDELLQKMLLLTWVVKDETEYSLTDEGFTWLEQKGSELAVEEEDNDGNNNVPLKPYDVVKLKMEPKHLSVFQALRKIEKHEICLNPEFQRAFVWDEVRQSRLIESVLIRIPLPAFYLDATDQVSWNVVDGLQRLTTLYRYCREQEFALSGLQFLVELEGKHFDDLPPKYKVLIEDDTQLLFYNLMPGTPIEAKFTIFSRVNTGGMQLTPQEIRHALNQGKATILLGKLAKSSEFLMATEGVVESKRMSDRELVLRSLSFMHFGVDAYKQFNELDGFLLHSMTQLNKLTDNELEKLAEDFKSSLIKTRNIFGKYSFRKFNALGGRRAPLNKALFEVWTVCVHKYDEQVLISNKSEIVNEFINLITATNGNFSRSISSSTGKFSSVSTRFVMIEKLLERVCK